MSAFPMFGCFMPIYRTPEPVNEYWTLSPALPVNLSDPLKSCESFQLDQPEE